MGEEAEYLYDHDEYHFERDLRDKEKMERKIAINKTAARLSELSDPDLLLYLCKKGSRLDTLNTFKTYTIARRLKDNGWAPTKRQREALINTAAIALNS